MRLPATASLCWRTPRSRITRIDQTTGGQTVHGYYLSDFRVMPRLRLLIAPSLPPLLDHLADSIGRSPLPPRENEVIVVQSQGMRRWLTQQLADRFGCAGSLTLPFPTSFVHDISQRIAPNSSASGDADPFSRDVLQWRVDALLRVLPTAEGRYQPLNAYLAGSDERARFGLASQIAARFDDYQMYRADVLGEWEAGRDTPGTAHAPWQAQLWRTLCASAGGESPHLAARQRRIIDALQSASAPALPSRVTVFGVSTLPPLFIELITALARHVPVTVYSASVAQASPHPLAAALGTQSRDLLAALVAHGALVTALDGHEGARHGLLASLQRELSTDHTGDTPIALAADDATLRVHDAHGNLRQLEILRDQLTSALADDPTLRPHDLLLLVPDAAEWAPLVDAVFGASGDAAVRLPYHIADRPARRSQPAADALSRLLALEGGRLARSEVFSFLAHPLARQAAGLTEAEVETVERLTQRANVRWGYDAAARTTLGLPTYEDASWRLGLDRLLLGVAVGPSSDTVFGVLAESGDTAGDPETLGKFAAWVEGLENTLAKLREPQSVAAWTTVILTAVDALLRGDEPAGQQALDSIAQIIRRLGSLSATAGHSAAVPFGVVRDWIEGELDQDGFGSGFLAGGMTVAALKPMRSLPFRVIAVAGLDDAAFPRRVRRTAFDLLALERRSGDRDLRSDDRQLFLDMLLAAGDRLILAYSGRDVHDNSARAPSVVIDELLDHLDRRTAGAARPRLVVLHPLQPFSHQYFAPGRDPRLFTYSVPQARAARARTHQDERERPFVGSSPGPVQTADDSTLVLTLRDLTDCWTNPSRFFCRSVLQFSLEEGAQEAADDELLALDKLMQGGVKSRMLADALNGVRDEGRERRRLIAKGELPPGDLGVSWHEALTAEVDEVLALVDDRSSPIAVPISIDGDGWRLQGRIDGIRGNHRLVARAGGVRVEHRIRAWVEHVAMCAARERGETHLPGTTTLFGKGGVDEVFGTPGDASTLLEALMSGARQARNAPLPFFAQSGWAWFSSTRSKAGKKKGGRAAAPKDPRAAATAEFHREPNDFSPMPLDREDPYVMLCFRGTDPMERQWGEFERLARVLFAGWPSAGVDP